MTSKWLDENPELLPDPARTALYTAIMLQYGPFQRPWMWDRAGQAGSIWELAKNFDPAARELERIHTSRLSGQNEYMDKLLVQYQVWCALREET